MSDGSDLPFDVRVSEADGSTVVTFTGDLDVVAVPRASRAIEDAQSAGGTVVLDLRHLRFMDSSGLRVVLAAQRRASELGARLLVAPGEAGVRRLFDLSGVGALIELVDAPPEAA
ncbi:MAG: STAS domain-containing protein [Actinomycetota bacterium]|nr:STAS domain-containing protein [Actinomycetota bacterium]